MNIHVHVKAIVNQLFSQWLPYSYNKQTNKHRYFLHSFRLSRLNTKHYTDSSSYFYEYQRAQAIQTAFDISEKPNKSLLHFRLESKQLLIGFSDLLINASWKASEFLQVILEHLEESLERKFELNL